MKGRGVAAALASFAIAIGLAACGGGDRDASLKGGEADVVSSPEEVSPEDAAATQDFWTPQQIAQAENNPVELPTLPKNAAPGEAPKPEGGETTVEPAAPSSEPPPAPGGTTKTGKAGGGGGFQVSSLPEATDPFRTNGKLLVTFKGGQVGSCSATMINAPNQSLVATAGHCVFDHQSGLGWGSKFTFIPGYKSGKAPYGEWVAQFTSTFPEWINGGNFNYDFALLSLFRSSANQPLQSLIGARAITFNYNPEQPWGIIGYPAVSPYTGDTLLGCATSYSGSVAAGPSGPNNIQAPCDFTQGSSGGGWMIGGQNGNALGSVTSTKAPGGGAIDGPYLGNEALGLYNQEKDKQTSPAGLSGPCLKLKKALAALAKAKKKAKASPSPAATRAVAKAKAAVKKAKKKAKKC